MTIVLPSLNVASFLISARKKFAIVFMYISVFTHFTWVGVKSEVVNRFSSHIQLELCATPVPFGSIFPGFLISVVTDLSRPKISCDEETLPFDL